MIDNKIILPNYNNCILNLINSILKYYKVNTKYNGLNKLDKILEKNYKNIVLIILDGMGEHILKNISPKGFLEKNKIDVITSVCPSTTTAAMTTYYSGKPPIETGWIAMVQYFKEYGRAIELLRGIESYTKEPIRNVRKDIYELMEYDTIFNQIENASSDVKAYEINPEFCKSRSKRNIKADTIDILCDSIEAICKNDDKNFILGYQTSPDDLLHKNGSKSKEVSNYIINAEKNIEKLCGRLENSDTLVLVCADHGHQGINKTYSVLEMDELQDCIYMPVSLESRCPTFWVKENKKEKFEKYFEENLKDEFILYTKEEFLKNKFLGEGNMHPKIDDFIGNYIAIAISDSIIKLETYLGKAKGNKKSTHCGFTPNEMEVPFIAINCK